MYGVRVLVFGALVLLLLLLQVVVTAQITHPNEVSALRQIREKLKDPMKNLNNWKKGDPCESNWTGIVCFDMTKNTTKEEEEEEGEEEEEEEEELPPKDGYQHIRELNFLRMNLSGTLSPKIGELSYLKILDFMWNDISGSIPKEIGNIKTLQLLVLNGNQLNGSLPEELGFLPDLYRLQIDENNISGPIPKTFANLTETKHFHMSNNSISGQIPSELSRLPSLAHFLLDNNKLSGPLPPELSELPKLLVLQLDNNHLDGTIPASYGDMKKLLKLSLRNCNLQGAAPDLSRIPRLGYLDLSWNRLSSMPSNKLSENITTIDLSYNNLSGPFPANFSGLPHLQRLSLENNSFSGEVSSTIWLNRTFNETERLQLNFQNNRLSNISGSLLPANVFIRLEGNPLCEVANQPYIIQLCSPQTAVQEVPWNLTNTAAPCSCPQYYENVRNAPEPCFCAAPLGVEYRLKSPGFTDFRPYESQFENYLVIGLLINHYQLYIPTFVWEKGPRLEMSLKFYPEYNGINNTFNESEIQRITSIFKGWKLLDDDTFGPYDPIGFSLLGPYEIIEMVDLSKSGLSKGAVACIVLGAVAGAIALYAILSTLILRKRAAKQHAVPRKIQLSRAFMKIDGVKDFTFKEMALATNNFSESAAIGQGGYGKVYKGVLTDGTIVAVKRALEDSLQGEKEFMTEIALLSRVHHRNLVSLIGFCDQEDEQMLVYEYMPNGTLKDCLSFKSKEAMGFAMRLRIALGSAKGILYLHTEADPPIFHRDIKASNILLDSGFTAKVADFGLSKLAPVPDLKGTTPGHVSTVVKGTPGYLDPEYFLTQMLTDKSDVYSLGVVFLELLTGKQPISHGKNIVREVSWAYTSGLIFSVIDGRMGSYPLEGVERFVTLALSCCQDETDDRPSMADVVRELEKIWSMIPDGEARPSDSVIKKPNKGNTQSSNSATKNFYVSSDISGSNLVSGAIPTVTPR